MQGIVSLLDDTHEALVHALWEELERRFGLRGVYLTPYPHFSYHVAREYAAARVRPVLRRLAAEGQACTVRTSGLGLFTGPSPVLYVPVVRSRALTEFQERVWEAVSPLAVEAVAYYEPDRWVPHITLGFGDVRGDLLAEVMRGWAERPFEWEFRIDSLAHITDSGGKQEVGLRCDFEK